MQESFFIQEKITGEYALPEKLLEEIARCDGHFPERFLRMLRFPIVEFLAGARKILSVKQMKTRGEFRNRFECRAVAVLVQARGARRRCEKQESHRAIDSQTHPNLLFRKTQAF
jgi:hypothetical protein